MGNFFSDALGGIKHAVVGAGHAIGNVADNKWTKAALAAGLAATGVGAPAAAGLMAGEGLLGGALHNGGGLRDAATGAATGAVAGYGAGKAGGLLRGALGVGQGVVGGGPNVGDPATGEGGIADASAGGSQGAPGGGFDWGGLLKSGGSLLGNLGGSAVGGSGGNGLSPAILALAGLQGVNAAQLGAKSNQYADNAMQTANDAWQAKAGLRSAGIAGLAAPRPMQNLSGLTAIRAQNPVAARAALPVTGS